ncbi:TPA: hypothetical protein ENS27_15665 [bacterium]|nr:hypothetical protein [bacterium]
MKYYICLVFIFLLLPCFAYTEEQVNQEKQETTKTPVEIIAAEVNGKPIFLSDVTRELNMLTGGRVNRQDTATYNMLSEQILNSLINQEIIYQAGQKEKLEPQKEELDKELEKVKSMQPPEQFQQALKAFGLTEEKLILLIKRNLTIRRFIEAKIQPTIKPITEEDILRYYEENKGKYVEPEQVRARHILIKVSPDADEQTKSSAKEKIQGILDKLHNGGDFVELAKEYSECPTAKQGGDLDYFRRGVMVKPFEDAAFALQPNEVSDIVETEFGYHIIKLEDKKAGRQLAIEEVESKIEDALSQKEMDEALGNWLKPEREKASIKFLLKDNQPSATRSTEK